MASLGEAIRRLRLAGGYTQKELAERVDSDPTYLSHVESGRREPSLTLLRTLARELKVPPGLLLAVALWSDLPPSQKRRYRPILDKLVSLGAGPAHTLQLDD
ncbi:MAG: helix-turn-helix transcriptional regulator [Gemmatimonadetes bacterium]|nr:helix-turn-helix transcriptional regulator [Gemmatimonadota bacterium]MBK7925758.1 helix-turn-helix transcriptional regulator [Gemmatimonadota bacterium]